MKIYDKLGDPVTSGYIGTGMTVKLEVDSIVEDELTVLVLGDVDGNGQIDTNDYTLVRLDILELMSIGGLAATAADVDKNDIIDTNDYTLIRLDILDLLLIN